MSLTQYLGQGRSGWPEENPAISYFNFVVAERPKYMPNSGPPSAPISFMPVHDKDGIILEKVEPYGAPFFYLVGYEARPQLRVGVKPQNILDWVSPRTFETFELEQSKLRDARKIKSANIKAQKQREPNISYSKPSQSSKPSARKKRKHHVSDDQTPRPKRTRSGSNPLLAPLAGPTRRRKRPEQDQIVFASPTTSQKSKGPSLVTPVKRLRVVSIIDSDMIEQDSYDTDAALADQLNDVSRHPSPWNQPLQSEADTPTLSQTLDDIPEATSQSGGLISNPELMTSCQSSSTRNRVGCDFTSSPSKAALEDIEHNSKASQSEHNNKSKGQPISQQNSNFKSGPTMFSKSENRSHFATGTIPLRSGLNHDDEEGEELEDEDEVSEWELDDILDDAVVDDQQFYLIKWVGDWDNSWEPAGNVSKVAVLAYERKKQSMDKVLSLGGHEDAHHRGKNSSAGGGTMGGQATSSSSGGGKLSNDHILGSGNPPNSDIIGANLQHQQSEESSLFITDNWSQDGSSRENFNKPERKPPGQVVDDDATSGCTDDIDTPW